MKFAALLILFFASLHVRAGTSAISFHIRSATVWLPEQTVSGSVADLNVTKLLVHLNDSSFAVSVDHGEFSFTVMLYEMKNMIWAETTDYNAIVQSDTLFFELGYKP